jgi:predicted RNase H-like HicB family nuclease
MIQYLIVIEKTETRYLIVIEKTETGYSAYSPDLPGCVSTGATREEVAYNMREAVEFHLEGLKLEELEIPQPTTSSVYIEVVA